MIGSAQLTLILSAVAGANSCNGSVSPNSFLAAFSASLIAKKTDEPRKRGGSPTPRERWMVRRFFHSTSLRRETLKVWGMSRKPGILYAPGPRVKS